MTRIAVGTLVTLLLAPLSGVPYELAGGVTAAPAQEPRVRTAPVRADGLSLGDSTALVRQYCATCHSDRGKAGGLTLATFDAADVVAHADVAEKMIRKLRTGMMPPPGAKRPDASALAGLATALEQHLDRAAASRPHPGSRPFQRLNRAEYARSVHDLLGIDVDVSTFLPPDTLSSGFDNVADVQASSATLMEGYLRAASRISLLAIGDRHASPTEATYRLSRTASQMHHVEGAPIGTRGGLSVVHVFPADGEYSFRIQLQSSSGQLFGSTARDEQLEVSINGARVALLDISPQMSETDPNGMNLYTPRVPVKAGPQRVSAAFIQRFTAPVDDLIAPIEHTMADGQIGLGLGVTTLPHVFDVNINGPFTVTGVSETVSRRRIFTCRPATAADETPCARTIVRALATQAYRGAVSDSALERLMGFYTEGRATGDFESGIRLALQAILAGPRFLFRFEQAPSTLAAGQAYRIGDVELASRLSYFLWATAPDAPFVSSAMTGTLTTPTVLDRQVTRMLADPRVESLASRFAFQWLRLQDLDKIQPDPQLYPYYDRTLGDAMAEETRLFFANLVREDRSVLELLTADYTFVNDRLARHYGIPGVAGSHFRKVTIPGDLRRGVLGQGSVLTLTSVADRTSPVLRGKWVMEVLLGSPPPPPPPNVPELEPASVAHGGRTLTVRERMEAHRANPACTSCHRVIDPLGLALESFDATGAYRIKDNGQPIDASGELYDGTTMNGPVELRNALLQRKDVIVQRFAESLLTYALGRRLEAADMPAVRAIVRDAAPGGHRIRSFIKGVIDSAAFRMNEVGSVDTSGGNSEGTALAVPRNGRSPRSGRHR